MTPSDVLRRALFLVALLVPGAPRAEGQPAAPPLTWRYAITFDAAHPRLDVEWSELDAGAVRRARATTRLYLCVMMTGAGAHVRDAAAGATKLTVDPEDDDCFSAELAPGEPLSVHYAIDLAAMADDGDFDYAAATSGGWVGTDKALLLRPYPLPPLRGIEVDLKLPDGVDAAAPWERLPGAGARFRLDSDQLLCGGYLALGKLRRLPDVKVRGGAMTPVLLDGPHRASDDELSLWVARASNAVADFYGGLPQPRVTVILVPARGSTEGGVFGTVLRRAKCPSAVLMFGAEARGTAFEDDWVSTHELFHLGNPDIDDRVPWFTEGFTTYYQDVLRGRMQPVHAAALWTELVHEFGKHCEGADARPLAEESRNMRRTHRWTRVYWGGACVAFQADVAIRRRSHNRESLDSVLRAMLVEGRRREFSEPALVARLDRAVGRPLVRELLRKKGKAPVAALYRQLGIEPAAPDTVRLRDDAPLAPIRKSIF